MTTARDLLRDVLMDWVPECETDDCTCSAARARAYLAQVCGTCNGSGIAPDQSPQPDDEQPCPECVL